MEAVVSVLKSFLAQVLHWSRQLTLWLLQGLVLLYRYTISPLLGNNCRYTPSCSEYAMEALQLHGPLKGGWLTLKRLGRCHPFSHQHGWDPVPGSESTQQTGRRQRTDKQTCTHQHHHQRRRKTKTPVKQR